MAIVSDAVASSQAMGISGVHGVSETPMATAMERRLLHGGDGIAGSG